MTSPTFSHSECLDRCQRDHPDSPTPSRRDARRWLLPACTNRPDHPSGIDTRPRKLAIGRSIVVSAPHSGGPFQTSCHTAVLLLGTDTHGCRHGVLFLENDLAPCADVADAGFFRVCAARSRNLLRVRNPNLGFIRERAVNVRRTRN
jgi:hypothetical protein